MDNQQETELELAWLAGFFDAEGTVCFTKSGTAKGGQTWWNKKVAVVNYSAVPIERAVSIFDKLGVRPAVYEEQGGKIHRLTMNSSVKIEKALTPLIPYLAEKRPYAMLMLDYLRVPTDAIIESVRKKDVKHPDEPVRNGIENDLAWLAGFIDGDGCICVTHNGTGYRALVALVNKSEANLAKIRSILADVDVSWTECATSNKRAVQMHIARQVDVERLLRLVEPVLIEKQAKARLTLRFFEAKNSGSSETVRQAALAANDKNKPQELKIQSAA